MSPERMSPEEFARLMALPADHPERRRMEHSPEFEARVHLLHDFESPGDGQLTPDERAAGRELEARLAPMIATARAAAPPRTRRAAWSWLKGGGTPRAALAFASVALVAVLATWMTTHDGARRAVRGAPETAAFELAAPRPTAGGVRLAWPAVAGADHYRLVFFGPDMDERARIESLTSTTLELRAGALPAGLTAGTEALVGVVALHGPDPLATTPARLVRLP